MAEELKVAGNKLFVANKYQEAIEKYSAAITLSWFHFCKLLLNELLALHSRMEEGLVDAKKSTQLDHHYSKGWFRRGVCEDALGNIPESIESYETALKTATTTTQKSQIEAAISKVQEKILDPRYLSVDLLYAIARAHDMALPAGSPTRDILRQTVTEHPLFGEEPKLRLLFIPQSETEDVRQIELVRDQDIEQKIAQLLGCELVDAVMLHSQGQIAKAKNQDVGIGRLHESYELWMDDMAVYNRPLNERASRLLHRPQTHGPVLLQKTTMMRRDKSPLANSGEIISFERVTEDELNSDDYKKRREEWLHYQGTADTSMFTVVL
ncbi:TPR-REGION domain-containing protein [Mycena indigotica]|uniref:TPR-REGION domain-containing protein n=1 Tax=Mycena indigotica TaxID=2126181 RepID=A0A8H6VZ88_9AGAR|nr:TPR-REGION domain-containing protein [Mycena indigotica]KAF7297286.1 TPR-REGION domain-containing protein [Mycena indigotica]